MSIEKQIAQHPQLGKVRDREIAIELQVPVTTVSIVRRAMGIAPVDPYAQRVRLENPVQIGFRVEKKHLDALRKCNEKRSDTVRRVLAEAYSALEATQ